MPITSIKAHSGISEAKYGFVGHGKTLFKYETIPNKLGQKIERNIDSEYKIFSNIADALGENYQATGHITIFTERYACRSCRGVAEQFKKRYPNIDVHIMDNKDNILNPNKR